MDSFHIGHKWPLAWEGVSRATTFDLDLYLQGQPARLCSKTARIWQILSCPLHSTYSSAWILFIFGTDDHWHERVCRVQLPLTLTYIFRVTQPWICCKSAKIWHISSCLLHSMYSSGWILSIFGRDDHWHERVCRVQWYEFVVGVIMGWRGVSSERRRSSCSSFSHTIYLTRAGAPA